MGRTLRMDNKTATIETMSRKIITLLLFGLVALAFGCSAEEERVTSEHVITVYSAPT